MPNLATATFLFTDLVSSTELRSSLGDDAADVIQARIDSLIDQAVVSQRGQVVKRMGDGMMVLFSSAADALSAATGIQDGVSRLDEGEVQVRIGVNSGEVSERDGEYSGLPVVIAARLCDLADGGQILTTGLVRSLVGSRGGFGFAAQGGKSLKGITDVVEVWEVHDAEAALTEAKDSPIPFPTFLERLVASGLVGREGPLARLGEMMEKVVAGERQVALIAGEPGIGKSALASVFAKRAADDGAVVLAGRSPSEAVTSYQPFIEVLRHVLRSKPSLLASVPGAPELARLVPDLADRISLPPAVKADPGTQRYVLFEAFTTMVNEMAARAAVVLLLDDLHWADESSLALFHHMCTHPEQASVLILGTYRDTDLARTHPLSRTLGVLRRERRFIRVNLDGLDRDQVGELVGIRVGGAPSDQIVAEVSAETEGNPFFVEEVVSYLLESGVVNESGTWQASVSLEELGVPEGIRDVIGRRLEQLDTGTNETLAVAAVVGREFDLDVVETVVGLDASALESQVERALASGLLEEGDRAAKLSFSHALIRQTLYEELSATRRARLHGRVARVLDETGAAAGELARHWAAANDLSKALETSIRAAEDAEAIYAYDDARRHLDLALEIWDEVDDTAVTGIDLAELYRRAAEVAHLTEGGSVPVELIESAIKLVDSSDDPVRAGLLHSRRSTFLWWDGRGEEARAAAADAVRIIPPEPPTTERATALSLLARVLALAGHVDDAGSAAEDAIAVATETGDKDVEGHAMGTLGTVVADRGDIDRGISLLRRAKEIAEEEHRLDDILRASNNLCVLIWRSGQPHDYLDEATSGYELARRYGVRTMGAFLLGHMAFAYLHLGEWERADEIVSGRLGQDPVARTNLDAVRAHLATRRGDFDVARAPVKAQMEVAMGTPDPQSIIISSLCAAELAYWEGRHAESLRLVQEALTRAGATQDMWFISWPPKMGVEAIRMLRAEEPDKDWIGAGRELIAVSEEAGATGVAHPVANAAHVSALWSGIAGTPDPNLWEEAVLCWEDLSMPHEVAWVRAGYAEDLVELGRNEEALEVIDAARETAQRLGARPLLERLDRAARSV